MTISDAMHQSKETGQYFTRPGCAYNFGYDSCFGRIPNCADNSLLRDDDLIADDWYFPHQPLSAKQRKKKASNAQ